jgi:hypothetical protein
LSKLRVTETTASWAESLGLDISKKPRWKVQLRLETTGVKPAIGAARAVTFFELEVTHEMWSVRVFCREKKPKLRDYAQFTWWADTGRVHPQSGRLRVTPPRALATIPKWLAAVERKHMLGFRRDRPTVKSTVKGAAAALAEWIAHSSGSVSTS